MKSFFITEKSNILQIKLSKHLKQTFQLIKVILGLAQMEEFQILNDQIRNPLTIIASIVTIEEGPQTEKILEQVQRIDDLVKRLDMGWIESNKVRSFLLRPFKHGAEL